MWAEDTFRHLHHHLTSCPLPNTKQNTTADFVLHAGVFCVAEALADLSATSQMFWGLVCHPARAGHVVTLFWKLGGFSSVDLARVGPLEGSLMWLDHGWRCCLHALQAPPKTCGQDWELGLTGELGTPPVLKHWNYRSGGGVGFPLELSNNQRLFILFNFILVFHFRHLNPH